MNLDPLRKLENQVDEGFVLELVPETPTELVVMME
jgi:hypothetical protein